MEQGTAASLPPPRRTRTLMSVSHRPCERQRPHRGGMHLGSPSETLKIFVFSCRSPSSACKGSEPMPCGPGSGDIIWLSGLIKVSLKSGAVASQHDSVSPVLGKPGNGWPSSGPLQERAGRSAQYDSKGAAATGKTRCLCKSSSWVLFCGKPGSASSLKPCLELPSESPQDVRATESRGLESSF